MDLYHFLEALLTRGGRIEDVQLVPAHERVSTYLVNQATTLLNQYLRKSVEDRNKFTKNRRFGFDRGSRIGDLVVNRVGPKASLRPGLVFVYLS